MKRTTFHYSIRVIILATYLSNGDVKGKAVDQNKNNLSLCSAPSVRNSPDSGNLSESFQRMHELCLHTRGVAEALLYESLLEMTHRVGRAGSEARKREELETEGERSDK